MVKKVSDLRNVIKNLTTTMGSNEIAIYKDYNYQTTPVNLLVDGTKSQHTIIIGFKLIHQIDLYNKTGLDLGNIALPSKIEVYYKLKENSQLKELKKVVDEFLTDYESEFVDPNIILYKKG